MQRGANYRTTIGINSPTSRSARGSGGLKGFEVEYCRGFVMGAYRA